VHHARDHKNAVNDNAYEERKFVLLAVSKKTMIETYNFLMDERGDEVSDSCKSLNIDEFLTPYQFLKQHCKNFETLSAVLSRIVD
jgi:hypothetical protein